MKEINWNLYRTFVEVYKTKSLPKAGKALDMTRTGVGQNVKSLNNQLGVTLFTFHPKGVEPTEAAHLFYKEIEPMLARIKQLEKNLVEFNRNSEGLIKIGCAEAFMTTRVAEQIRSFQEVYPHIKVELLSLDGADALTSLKQKDIDIVVGFLGLDNDEDVSTLPIGGMSQTIFAASKDFATKHDIGGVITQEKFAELPLIGVREFIPWKIPKIYADRMETVFQYVMRNMGVGWFWDDWLAENHPNDAYVTFGVTGFVQKVHQLLCAYMPKTASRIALAFIEHLNMEKPALSN